MVLLEGRNLVKHPYTIRNPPTLSPLHRSKSNEEKNHSIHAKRCNRQYGANLMNIHMDKSRAEILNKKFTTSNAISKYKYIGMKLRNLRGNDNSESRELKKPKQVHLKRNDVNSVRVVHIDVRNNCTQNNDKILTDDHVSTLKPNSESFDIEVDEFGKFNKYHNKGDKIRDPNFKIGTEVEENEFVKEMDGFTTLEMGISAGGPKQPAYHNLTCPTCHKFYTVQSIEFHAKVCSERKNEKKKNDEAAELMKIRSLRGPTRPPGHICYICGRRCTRSSWTIHERSCSEQWSIWNERLPKSVRHQKIPLKPNTTEFDLRRRVDLERMKGRANYTINDAFDDIMLETSLLNELSLEYL